MNKDNLLDNDPIERDKMEKELKFYKSSHNAMIAITLACFFLLVFDEWGVELLNFIRKWI